LDVLTNTQKARRSGFNLIGLIAVILLVSVLGLALFPVISNALQRSEMTRVGIKARDAYVAIIGANTEREPLGSPPVWPYERPPLTNSVTGEVEYFDFDSSTDFFNYLNGSYRPDAKRVIAKFDYSSLAGCGVPESKDGVLRPENNLWTIAKNIRDEMEDWVPILVTRNIDPESLPSRVSETNSNERLRINPFWEHDSINAVLIRKGGGMFMIRPKYMVYRVVYGGQTFDSSVDSKGNLFPPLKYISPLSKAERDKRFGLMQLPEQ